MRLKLGGWVIMILTMILFLTLVGIPPAGTEYVLDKTGIIVSHATEEIELNPKTSIYWGWILGALSLLSFGGTIAIGFFGRGYDPSLVYAPVVLLIGGLFSSSIISVFNLVNSYGQFWITSIIVVIFGALSGGFIMACLDYFGGR